MTRIVETFAVLYGLLTRKVMVTGVDRQGPK